MATVKITRLMEWFGVFRRIMIEVDGQEVGGVKVRGELVIDVPPGPHTFQAAMDWIGSEPLDVVVTDGTTTMIGVGAPFRRSMSATGKWFPSGNYKEHASRNNGLDIWQY